MIPQGCLIAAMLTASSTAATTSSSAPNQVDWASDWSEPGWTEASICFGSTT